METRKGWGMVVMASVFAVVVVAAAAGTYFYEQNYGKNSLTDAQLYNPNDEDKDGLLTWEEIAWHTDPNNPDTDGDGIKDGAEVAARTSPTIAGAGGNEYEGWTGSTPTEALSQNLIAAQVSLSGKNPSQSQVDAAVDNVMSKVTLPDLEEKIPLSALRVSASSSPASYGEIVLFILKGSAKVRAYELETFRQTVSSNNFSGTKDLKDAAAVYKKIEGELLSVQVPAALAADHIAVVNSIGTLANTVSAMGQWTGDPFAGLAYQDAFIKAELSVQKNTSALFTHLQTLLK